MHPAQGTRLDSWKAIADYLDRNVRTVTRWGDERGLPVHRVPGGKRQAVFAYTYEIDAWLVRRHPNNGSANGGPERTVLTERNETNPTSPDTLVSVKKRGFLRRFVTDHWGRLLTMGLCLLLFAWIVDNSYLRSQSSAALHPLRFTQVTDDGHVKTNLHIQGGTLFYNRYDGIRQVVGSSPVLGGVPRIIDTPFSNVFLEDVSKDGQKLLVTSFEGLELERTLWTIPVRGGLPQRVGQVMCRGARWSPDNGKIAFTNARTISVVSTDGSDAHVIASLAGGSSQLIWSSDGQRLRFLLQDELKRSISPWEIDVSRSGSNGPPRPAALALSKGCCVDWTWTRGDRDFAYVAPGTDTNWRLVVSSQNTFLPNWVTPPLSLPISMGKVQSLVSGTASNVLYLLIANAPRGQLLKYSLKEKAFEPLLPGLSAQYLSYSRDSHWLCFLNNLDHSMWRSRADGTGAIRLSAPGMEAQLCSWSPDGHQLAFMGKVPGKPWRIYLVGKDGGVPVEASMGTDDQGAPTWSPDGKTLVYGNVLCQDTQSCSIRIIDLDTGNVQTLPGSHGFRTARWAPDGRHIAALQPETHELMIFDPSARQWQVLAGSVKGDDLNWTRDSQYIYVDSPQGEKPVIDRIRIKDGQRSTIVSLSSLQRMPGRPDMWFGITPDDSPIVLHLMTSSEVYALDWRDH